MSSYIKSGNNEMKLVDAIKEVSKTKEFSSIINNISETIHKLNDTNDENIAAQMNNPDSKYNIENYDSDDDNLESISHKSIYRTFEKPIEPVPVELEPVEPVGPVEPVSPRLPSSPCGPIIWFTGYDGSDPVPLVFQCEPLCFVW